jgi:GT2 family glycosyltransferase
MSLKGRKHVAIVEAYQGYIEYLSDELEELKSAQGLGLPVEDIAETLDCRITVFCWDEWLRYELSYGSPFTWVQNPVTRPTAPSAFVEIPSFIDSHRVRRIPVPARDPIFRRPFSETGLSPQSHGLIANNDLMFFLSYCLKEELAVFHRADPFHAVILPAWGGLGYHFQLARATGAEPSVDVPCIMIATDTSAGRQLVNQEGYWTLEATIRRQMEDVSLALADETLAFGPRGASIGTGRRLPEAPPPVFAPRRVPGATIDRIAGSAAREGGTRSPAVFFLNEPQQPASGALTLMDGVALLGKRGVRLPSPVISAGPSMIFAPMKPRDFRDYWSSRGFVREIVRQNQWRWERSLPPPGEAFRVRLYPSSFEHLPDIWTELARGALVLLSPAAAEGLAPGERIPDEVLLKGEPDPENLADAVSALLECDVHQLDRIRRRLCHQVVAGHRGGEWAKRLEATAAVLGRALYSPPKPQDLSRIARLLLDRCRPLRDIASDHACPAVPVRRAGTRENTLSVIVTCYEMGILVKETVESIWASERIPDELLLIDDGSQGTETLRSIEELEAVAVERRLPLRVLHQENRGLSGARNAGLEAAAGEFVSFMDGDDLIDRRFYRIALDLVGKDPGLDCVAAWALCFRERALVGFWNAPQPELPLLFLENGVIVPCLMRAEVLRGLSGYDTGLRYNYEDWELAIRMIASGRPIVTIPMYLMKYRIRSDSLYRSMTPVQNQVMRERIFAMHRETVARFGGEIAMLLENRMMRYMHAGIQEMAGGSGKPTGLAQFQVRDLLHEAFRKLRRLSAGKMREPASGGKIGP